MAPPPRFGRMGGSVSPASRLYPPSGEPRMLRGIPDASLINPSVTQNAGGGISVSVGGQPITAETLQAAVNLDPATVQAKASAALGQLSTDAQLAWQQQTSSAANEGRKAAGVAAATQLATNGYNPDSAEDNGKLLAVVAGAVAFIPAVGPILSGAVLVLYAIGEAVAKILEAVGLIGPFGCFSSGNWTPKTILSAYPKLPPMGAGSFASLAVPTLAQNAARAMNCEKGLLSNDQVLAALMHFWNANASGPPTTVYVPAMAQWGFPFLFASQVPYAFEPAATVNDFPGTSSTPSGVVKPIGALGPEDGQSGSCSDPSQCPPNLLIGSASSAFAGTGATAANGPMVIQLSGSSFGSAAPSKLSTAAKVAIGIPATLTLGTFVYAWAMGHSVETVFAHLWAGAKSFVRHVAGEARSNPLELFERQATTVQSLLFSRGKFDARAAKSWARKHGYRASKVDTRGSYVRLRQRPPSEFVRSSFRTIDFGGSGIKAVIGHLR